MKVREKFRYISNRIFILGIAGVTVLLTMGVVLAVLSIKEPVFLGLTLIIFVLTAGLILVFWFWIAVPYMDYEKKVRRFLEGYIFTDGIDFDMPLLTPSMQAQIEMMDQVLKSPQRMDLNKRQAQYLALQNQINPHFLYNTLESIRGEALIAGLDTVAEMTEALAKFFRYTITKVENLVSVEEELDNCENYFWIQKYRFGERLMLHIQYEPEEYDLIMNCRIPKLTLQPILENSIIHGTELKIGTGNLYICFGCTEDRLIIRISDDGVGMDEGTLARLNRRLGRSIDSIGSEEEKQGGIALANVNNRIHLLFGDEYGMHVYSVEGSGTDVEITLPLSAKEF